MSPSSQSRVLRLKPVVEVVLKRMPADREWGRAFATFEAEARRGRLGTEPPMTLAASLRGGLESRIPLLVDLVEEIAQDARDEHSPLEVAS